MSLLEIDGLTHSFGENVLYKNAGFTLNKGEHIGIVGQNGTGKSTLIKICTEQIIPDSGRIVWQPNTTVGYLDQYAEIDHSLTMKEFLKSAFSKLFDMEAQAMELYEKAADGDMKSLELAAHYQEQLEAHDFYSIDTAIERVANGLGLLAIGLDRSIAEMSGGQRAKVILAKLLLEKPDVLLLDEPTNFLDKDHVTWLAEYLSALENAFLVVSHDFDFLDKIANRICDIDNDTITKYYGTYSEFLRKKSLLREDYMIGRLSLQCCQLAGFQPRIVHASKFEDNVLEMVRKNVGVSILLKLPRKANGIVILDMKPTIRVDLNLLYCEENASPAVRELIRFIREQRPNIGV